MHNKSWFFMIILIAVSVLQLAAQPRQDDTLSNKGKKAFTFSVNGLSLTSGLGGTYWVSNDYALSIIASGRYDYHKDLSLRGDDENASLTLTALLKMHFRINRSLSPYIGSGLGVSLYYDNDQKYLDQPSKSGSLILPVLAGIEYWFTENISMAAEQSVEAQMKLQQTSRDFELSSSTSSLLLSVYF